MRIAVTGANGLVGSRLCRLLVERKFDTVGLARGPQRIDSGFAYVSVDIADPQALQETIKHARPDVIINTASMTEVDACEKNPEQAYAVNVTGAANVARAAREVGAHLIHVSTDYVFDGNGGPYSEQDLPNPRGVYAVTKHMGEEAVRIFAPSFAIARTAVVYGWPPSGRPNFGSWLLQTLLRGEPVRLFQDQWVSPSLALSVAAQLAEMAERKLSGIWNTCGAEVMDRVTFGRALCSVFGLDAGRIVPVAMKDVPLASPRPARCGLKTDKALRELKEKPLPLTESLQRFREEHRRGSNA